ncbi:MAG TPA: chemotaxis protein CheW [Bacteroidales bacterium]|nr:chemotaxis protein CheW [Bacteroidales bacterium]
MNRTYLSFLVYGQYFAVDVVKVLEVLQKQNIVQVPNAPAYVKGIINFRGEIVPVFDLRSKFNFPENDAKSSFVIIVLDLSGQNGSFRIGAIADKVKDVITIDDNAIKPVPQMSEKFNTEFLQGIFKIDDSFILLLNVDKVFSNAETPDIQNVQEKEVTNL